MSEDADTVVLDLDLDREERSALLDGDLHVGPRGVIDRVVHELGDQADETGGLAREPSSGPG